jgi:hypothetical protein
MSIEATRWARQARTDTPAQKALLFALASYHHHERGERGDHVVWPGIARLAADLCINERTVRRALFELEAKGFIRIETRPNRGGWRSHGYELVGIGSESDLPAGIFAPSAVQPADTLPNFSASPSTPPDILCEPPDILSEASGHSVRSQWTFSTEPPGKMSTEQVSKGTRNREQETENKHTEGGTALSRGACLPIDAAIAPEPTEIANIMVGHFEIADHDMLVEALSRMTVSELHDCAEEISAMKERARSCWMAMAESVDALEFIRRWRAAA